uniref:DeoR/GlpR transcriptional regulator n=1 Tax=Anisakis simplex TaxID=6269 RepID=A0A0M3JP44_ANISI
LLRLDRIALFKDCCLALPTRRYRVHDSSVLASNTQQSYFVALEKQWDLKLPVAARKANISVIH